MGKDDAVKTNDGGTPLLDAETAHVPEAREDVHPMKRPGMPLHDPSLYEKTERSTSDKPESTSDPKAHSEDVRGGKRDRS